MSKQRVWAGDANVACQCKIESATHTVSVDGRHGPAGKICDCLHEPLTHEGEAKRFRPTKGGNLVKVGSGREKMCVAGDDQPAWVIRREFFDDRGEGQHTCACQTVCTVM